MRSVPARRRLCHQRCFRSPTTPQRSTWRSTWHRRRPALAAAAAMRSTTWTMRTRTSARNIAGLRQSRVANPPTLRPPPLPPPGRCPLPPHRHHHLARWCRRRRRRRRRRWRARPPGSPGSQSPGDLTALQPGHRCRPLPRGPRASVRSGRSQRFRAGPPRLRHQAPPAAPPRQRGPQDCRLDCPRRRARQIHTARCQEFRAWPPRLRRRTPPSASPRQR